jgi:heat shock protein HtpX
MAFAKRIVLFLIVNMAMVTTISVILYFLGIGRYQTYGGGLDLGALAAFCLVWGMTASLFSLAISRMMAKWMMGVQVIDPNTPGELGELVRTVHNLARAARLPAMPEVGIYDSPEVNAFATGPTKSRALVAVSTGLLRTMRQNELEGVLAHEITHVANGDMVTLTLIQGVVNAFVMFLARIAAFAVQNALSGGEDRRRSRSPFGYMMLTWVFEMIFGLVGAMIVAWFSRWREFRADAGGARLAGAQNMRGALQRLLTYKESIDVSHPSMNAFKISSRPAGMLSLFASHPPLEERIQRLENA